MLAQLLSACPWTSYSSSQTGSHSRLQTLYFSMILLPAGTQTKPWVTDRTNLLETWKKRNFLQILTRCFIATYFTPFFPLQQNSLNFIIYNRLYCYNRFIIYNRFVIYNKVLSCEPLNILLKSQEVRQLFEFHKEKQMWFHGLTLMVFNLWGRFRNIAFLWRAHSLVCSPN